MTNSGTKTQADNETRDRRIIAWCAQQDVKCHIHDDPQIAMSGWLRAAEHASQHVGADPIVEIIGRIGIQAASKIYEETLGEAENPKKNQS